MNILKLDITRKNEYDTYVKQHNDGLLYYKV